MVQAITGPAAPSPNGLRHLKHRRPPLGTGHGLIPRHERGHFVDRHVQRNRHDSQRDQACKHQINFGAAIGEQHQIAKPFGRPDPFANHGPKWRVHSR